MQIKIFSKLYAMTLRWSQHRSAPWLLGAVSFAESSVFPIPPDVMLLPMCIANRARAWWYALITTLTSVLGAIVGFLIGLLAADVAVEAAQYLGWESKFATVEQWYAEYGLWVVFVAGFTPIPYKIFTIGSGMFGMALLPFLLISIIARGARYSVVAAAGYYGGPIIERHFMKYFDLLGLMTVAVLFLGWLIYRIV